MKILYAVFASDCVWSHATNPKRITFIINFRLDYGCDNLWYVRHTILAMTHKFKMHISAIFLASTAFAMDVVHKICSA